MSTDTKQLGPKQPPPPARRLRDDPTFISLYGQILSGLYARLKPPVYFEARDEREMYEHDLHEVCASNAKVAYLAAKAAYAELLRAEPETEARGESTTETFNAKVA